MPIVKFDTINRVSSEGSKEAKVAIIGEAPGAVEDREGKPFAGPAGSELNRLLNAAGILRQNVYITNVVKERPPRNDISIFIKWNTKGAITKTEAYEKYEAELKKELEQVSANVLVPMGNVALYALTGERSITKYRGSILESTLLPGKKVIPTIHPAAAIRQYDYKHFIVHDLKRVQEQMGFPEIRRKDRTYLLKPTFYEVMSYLEECEKCSIVAFDIEVVNEEVSCISFAISDDNAISIPFLYEGRDYFDVEQEGEIWRKIASILENKEQKHLGQNVLFDATFLFNRYGIRAVNLEDTMVAEAIITPEYPKGLDFITSIYTEEPYYKDDGKRGFVLSGQDESFWLYNAKDSIICMEAFPKMLNDLSTINNAEVYRRQVSLLEPLAYMTARGMKVDVEGIEKASLDASIELESLQEKLNEAAGEELNPNSPKQLKEYFYIKRGHKPYMKKGSISTDEVAMKRLARKGIREADLILRMRKLRKLKGTYFDMNLDGDNRIRSSFNPVGTTTGRLSSSKTIFGTGGNMQNLPGAMKQFILADDDYILYDVDLSQAENRIVSYIAPEPLMMQAFEEGKDIHSQTASMIFNIPPDIIREMNSKAEEYDDIDDVPDELLAPLGNGTRTHRYWGKTSNHALNYDFGYKQFALKYEITEKEAKVLVERYHTIYPGIRSYHEWVRNKLGKDRTLTNIMGRNRIFRGRWGDDLFKEAYAFIPQSTVADIINERGLIYIWQNEDKFEELELLNQVHDSIVFQIPISAGWDRHAEMLLNIKKSLETPLVWHGREFVIPAEASIGFNLKHTEDVDTHLYNRVDTLSAVLRNTYESLLEQKNEQK